MDSGQSSGKPSGRFFGKGKRDQVIDTTLNVIDLSLKILDGAKDFIPVAGVGGVVPVLQVLVDQIRVSTHKSLI